MVTKKSIDHCGPNGSLDFAQSYRCYISFMYMLYRHDTLQSVCFDEYFMQEGSGLSDHKVHGASVTGSAVNTFSIKCIQVAWILYACTNALYPSLHIPKNWYGTISFLGLMQLVCTVVQLCTMQVLMGFATRAKIFAFVSLRHDVCLFQ